MRLRHLLAAAAAIALPLLSPAQTGTVRGFVYEQKDGSPVMFTNVLVEGTTLGASTNLDGYYAITKIPAGDYTLKVHSLGYDTARVQVSVRAGQTTEANVLVRSSSVELEEFVVSAEKQEMKTQVFTSLVKITPKQVEMLPSVGGERDIAQFLQIVPGVVFTGDQGGQLYIRGGSQIQNKVLLDGMTIFNPFHSIGIFSVFDTDIIKNTDVYTGGFNVEYGGRTSSIMDFATREGNKRRFSGKASASTLAGRLLVEGPIIPMRDDRYSSISYLLSAKRSYIEPASRTLYSYMGQDLPFGFTDLYGKLSLTGKSGSKLNVFGFSFDDKVTNYQQLADFGWDSKGFGVTSLLIPSGTSTAINMGFNYSSYGVKMESDEDLPRQSTVGNFGFLMNFTYFIGESELKFGVDISAMSSSYTYWNDYGYGVDRSQRTTDIALYAKYKVTLGNLILDPGVRFTNYSSLSESVAEPRLGAKWTINERLRVKAAGGLYSQNLIAANSEKDVVNLFYGFFLAPESRLQYQGRGIESSLQKSKHAVLGVEYDITGHVSANLEGYYKRFDQLVGVNNYVMYPSDATDKPALLRNELVVESGRAYGADLLVKYNHRQVSLWMVYSLGFVERTGEYMDLWHNTLEHTYRPHFDRRHSVNLVATYAFGRGQLWELSGRWNLGSGYPFTPNGGYYEQLDFPQVDPAYPAAQGALQLLFGQTGSRRLPAYHRLDLNLKRTIPLAGDAQMTVDLGATNIYNRDNIFYINRAQAKPAYQLPILPSVGMSISF